jgi:uncharacterized cupin superfamily protein
MPPNVFGDEWDAEQVQPGFTWKRLRLGQRLGAEKLGASVFELPPGQHSFPYHLHHANEEPRIIVLSTMIDPDITEFPDTGKVGLFAGAPPGGSAPRTLTAFLRGDAEVDYFEGEPIE